jgi:hypothetical protein
MPEYTSNLTVGTDSYISLVDAKIYWSKILGAEVTATAPDLKLDASLREACARIERHTFNGLATTIGQPLQFPRTGLYDATGGLYACNIYPIELKAAQCEEALMILKLDADKGAKTMDVRLAQGQNDVKIGEITVKYSEPQTYGNNGIQSERAWGYLQEFLRGAINEGYEYPLRLDGAQNGAMVNPY